MSDHVRIKFEPMSPSIHEDDDDTRSTVLLYNRELDENSEEDRKPNIIYLKHDGCIELSSDEDDTISPMRIRDRRTSARQSYTAPSTSTAHNTDRRTSVREPYTSSDVPTRMPERVILREIETQTEETTTTDVATSVDGELGATNDISVNTDTVTTSDIGINVDVEELLLNTVEAMDIDDPETQTPEDTATVESSENNETARKADENYYQCAICSCYYLSNKLLNKHSVKQHNKAMTDIKKVQYNMKCKFCDSTYVFATYNKHIKNKHADKFNKNTSTRRLDMSGPYECTICHIKFLSYNEAKRHRQVHANVEQKPILKKIRDNTNAPSSSKAKVEKPTSQSPSFKKAIPKSFLFQCPKCELNFFTYRNGLRHRIACEKGENKRSVLVNCAKCDRKFLSVHIKGHYQQHDMSNQFKIQPVVDGIEHKILYRCMKCKVCMEERGCTVHFQSGCRSLGIPCTLCFNKIDKDFMSKHKEAHSRMGLTKDEIILVDICD